MDKSTSIYVLVNPINNMAFYVGQSRKPSARLSQHIWSAANRRTRTAKLISEILAGGYKPEMAIMEEVSLEESGSTELWWVEYLKGLGCNLTNFATWEQDAYMGMSRRGKRLPPASQERKDKISASNKRRRLSQATKDKIGSSLRGRKLSDAVRKKQSEAQLKRVYTPEFIEKTYAFRRGQKDSDAMKKKRSEAALLRWAKQRKLLQP